MAMDSFKLIGVSTQEIILYYINILCKWDKGEKPGIDTKANSKNLYLTDELCKIWITPDNSDLEKIEPRNRKSWHDDVKILTIFLHSFGLATCIISKKGIKDYGFPI